MACPTWTGGSDLPLERFGTEILGFPSVSDPEVGLSHTLLGAYRYGNATATAFEAWSFAIARLGSARAVAEAALPLLSSFQAQGLANTAWALARLAAESSGWAERQLLSGVASEVARQARDFSPQGLANIGWAFATLAVSGAPRERAPAGV